MSTLPGGGVTAFPSSRPAHVEPERDRNEGPRVNRDPSSPAPGLPLAAAFGISAVVAYFEWRIGAAPVWQWTLFLTVLMALADLIRSPRPRRIEINRAIDGVLSMDDEQKVTLRVYNGNRRALRLTIRDEPPVSFERSDTILRTLVPGGSSSHVVYTVRPVKRGAYHFQGCTFRYSSPWRLWSWQGRIQLPVEVRVYPHLGPLRKQLGSDDQHRLEAGVHRPLWRGQGSDFDRVRDYVVDDEPRYINWLATARRGRLMVNEYRNPRNQTVILLFDAGRLGATYIGEEATRLDHAVSAALPLALTALRHDDYVGALVFADEVLGFLPPGRGSRQMSALLRLLYRVQPRTVESDYAQAFSFLSSRVRKRSLVCLFTDLAESESAAQMATHLTHLARIHLPVCVAIADPSLGELANMAPASELDVYTKAAARQTLGLRQRAASALRRRGVYVVDGPPERIDTQAVQQFLALKHRAAL